MMKKKPHRGYEGVNPAPGRDDSELDPYEIEFLPEFQQGRGPRKPFVNEHGVVIGDHEYASPSSPLEQWDEQTDPTIMAGEEWVHPYKDIGFRSQENRDLFEQGIQPQAGRFMHPEQQVSAADEPESSPPRSDDADLDEWFNSDNEYVLDEP